MPDNIPDWLAKSLRDPRVGHGNLVMAELGNERLLGRGGFALASPAFKDGDELDPSFTADEEDAVAPPLEWTAPPPGAQELVIVVEDVDAASPEPFCHWLVWGLPPQKGKLLEGEVPPRVGKNGHQNSEWLLPDLPAGDAPHQFVFQIFAVELPLTLMPGASRAELVDAIRGNVMAAAVLTGIYERHERVAIELNESGLSAAEI